MAAAATTAAPAVDGGDKLENYSWSQVLADLTVTVPLAAYVAPAEKVQAAKPQALAVPVATSSLDRKNEKRTEAAVAPRPRRLRGSDVACDIATSRLRVAIWPGTTHEQVIVDKVLSHEVVPAASEYSLTDDTLTVDLEKRIEGFWERLFEGDRNIDIRALGPAVGDVGKVHDPNEPQKIEDPEAISRVVKEHPELAAGLAQTMMQPDSSGKSKAAASLVTQTASAATYRGASAFEW